MVSGLTNINLITSPELETLDGKDSTDEIKAT